MGWERPDEYEADAGTDRLTVLEAARTLKLGLMVGFGYGILQDAVSLVRGRRLGYVDFVWNLRPHKAQG